jgi:hypothetical protein
VSWSRQFVEARGLGGTLLERVPVAGYYLDVLVEFDFDELRRRERHGVESRLLDAFTLEALAQLASGQPVPASAVDPITDGFLGAEEVGLVTRDGKSVTRVFRPALSLTAVLTEASPISRGLTRVSPLAAQAPRWILLSQRAEPTELNEARRLGVGVAELSRDECVVVLEADLTLARDDPTDWWLRESLLAEAQVRGVVFHGSDYVERDRQVG